MKTLTAHNDNLRKFILRKEFARSFKTHILRILIVHNARVSRWTLILSSVSLSNFQRNHYKRKSFTYSSNLTKVRWILMFSPITKTKRERAPLLEVCLDLFYVFFLGNKILHRKTSQIDLLFSFSVLRLYISIIILKRIGQKNKA